MALTDTERIAVLEARVADQKTQIDQLQKTVDQIGERAADRHDLHQRLQVIASALKALAAGQRDAGLVNSILKTLFGG